MSIIIRLQNLPWSANSVDIRRFFTGLSIPEGGVHIVGGEMGDAFIAFSTDEDARLAMAKDGGKIKDMQIRLLLSSRTEMMRVIEQARQQNTVLAQPPPPQVHQMMMPQVQQAPPLQHSARGQPEPPGQDRRRDRSPRHRSRDRSPSRDRRRSEDGRRRDSKRDRSRSPRGRSPRRDDRRGRDDRSKRDDRRHDDSRYRDDRRPSGREEPEPKKFSDGERPQKGEGFRDIQQVYDAVQNIAMSGLFQYGTQQLGPQGSVARSIHDSAGAASPAQALFTSGPFADPGAQGGAEQQQAKARRRTRFEPDALQQPSYPETQSQSSAYSIKRTDDRGGAWGAGAQPSNSVTPNGDFVQVVEMDIDPPEADSLIETGGSYPSPHAAAGQGPNRDSPLRGDPRGQHAYGDGPNRMGLPVQADVNRVPTSRGHNSDGYNSGPPLNSQSRIPSSLAVEVKGLPPDASITDILDLFRGISLPAANIRIEASERGFEAAYIRFTSAADFQEAMNRNRHFAKEGRCQLVPCPESAFEGASRGPPRGEPRGEPQRSFKPRPRPREEDLIVQLRGLPFSCTDDNIVKFFDGLSVLDIYIERGDDGRAAGIGYVEFGSHKDFREALVYNGKMIGHRYITISVGSKDMMQTARAGGHRDNRPPRDYNSDSRPNHGAPHHPPSGPPRPALLPSSAPAGAPSGGPPRQPPFCVFLKNLPDDVTNRHIAEFLNQAQVMPRAIHIMLRPDSQRPSGEAYAEFASPANMDAALKLTGQLMSGKPVQIAPISYFEMCDILGRPAQPPAPDGGLLRPPNLMERPRGPLLPQGPRDRPPRLDFPPRSMRPRMDGPPGRPRMDGPPGRPPLFGGPGRVRGPWPNRPPRFEGGRPSVDRGPKDFGSPGCVVAISNLHFKAGLEELLDFFKGYTVSKDNIIRKYNENGQTTGEARVAFPTPQEAQKVVGELNRKTIMGRSLNLSIV